MSMCPIFLGIFCPRQSDSVACVRYKENRRKFLQQIQLAKVKSLFSSVSCRSYSAYYTDILFDGK